MFDVIALVNPNQLKESSVNDAIDTPMNSNNKSYHIIDSKIVSDEHTTDKIITEHDWSKRKPECERDLLSKNKLRSGSIEEGLQG